MQERGVGEFELGRREAVGGDLFGEEEAAGDMQLLVVGVAWGFVCVIT